MSVSSQPLAPGFIVDAQLVHHVQRAEAVHVSGRLCAFQSATGEVELMAALPSSPFGMVVTRPSATSPSGYSSHHIGSSNLMEIDRFCITVTPNGLETMQAVDPEGNVYYRCNGPWAEGWQKITTNNDDGVNGPMSSWRFCKGTGGLFCITAAPVGGVFCLLNFHASASHYYTGANPFTLDALQASPATPEGWAPGTFQGQDGIFACFAASQGDSTYNLQFVSLNNVATPLGISVMVDVMSSVQTDAGQTFVFYSDDADSNIYFLNLATVPASVQHVALQVPLPPGIRMRELQASVSTGGQPEVFCRDSSGTLWHAAMEASTGNFASLLPLAAGVLQFSAAKNAAGYTVLFTVGRDGSLTRWMEDVDGDQSLSWRAEPVKLSPLDIEIPEIMTPSYAVLLTVEDSVTGIVKPGETISLWAEEPLMIECNGLFYEVGPQTPADLTTDAGGKLKLRYAADALHTPTLKLGHAFFQGEGGIVIDCAAAARSRLRAATAPVLGTASIPPLCSQAGQPLLNTRWQNHVNVVQEYCGALLGQVPELETTQTRAFLNRGRQQLGVAHVTSGWGTRNAAAPLLYWQMNFGDDPSFEPLLFEEAQRRTLAITSELTVSGFLSSLSDLWSAVANGTAELITMVRSGAALVVHFLLDSVPTYLRAVLDTAKGAVNALESALNQFGARLNGWLAWLGDLFAWSDILKTKVRIEKIWEESGAMIHEAIVSAQAGTHTFFLDNEAAVTAYFHRLTVESLSQAFPFHSFGSINELQKQPLQPSRTGFAATAPLTVQEIVTLNLSNNWLFDQAIAMVGKLIDDPFGEGPFANLLTTIKAVLQTPAVQEALTQIETLGNTFKTAVLDFVSGKDLQTVVLGDLLLLTRDFVLAMLKLLDAAIQVFLHTLDSLYNAFNDFVKATIDLGFLSTFYREVIAGGAEDISLLSLISLLIATPMTLMFKLAEDNRSPAADAPGTPLHAASEAEFRVWVRSMAAFVFGGFDLVLDTGATAIWLTRAEGVDEIPVLKPLGVFALIGSAICSVTALGAAGKPEESTAAALWGLKFAAPLYALMATRMGKPARSSKAGLIGQTLVGAGLLTAGIFHCIHRGDGDQNAIPDTLALMPGVWLCSKAVFPATNPTPEGALPPAIVYFFDMLNAGLATSLPLVQFYQAPGLPA